MSYLTTQQKSTLQALLTAHGLDAVEAFAAANALNAPASVSTAVPAPFTIGQVLAKLSTASQADLTKLPLAGHVIDSVNAQDRTAVGLYVATFAAQGVITSGEASEINAILAATNTVNLPGPSAFATAFPGFSFTEIHADGGRVAYHEACTAALVLEARS